MAHQRVCCSSLAFCLLAIVYKAAWAAPSPPTFARSFEVEYVFSLPYVRVVQSKGLSFPVHIWYDDMTKQMRTDLHGGLDRTYISQETQYLVYPRIDKVVCDVHNESVGPTGSGLGNALVSAVLPDLSKWTYAGTVKVANEDANSWQLNMKNQEKVSTYTFVVTQSGVPLKFHMMGRNILEGSHFDEYLLEFTSFKPGRPHHSVYREPDACKGVGPSHEARSRQVAAAQLALVMPWSGLASAAAMTPAGEVQLGELELARAVAYSQSVNFVKGWDAKRAGYSLALNKFSSWLHQEYTSLMLSYKKSRRASRLSLGTFQRQLRDDELPAEVDWRGTAADGIVKDQATCGSCWAFSAVGAMQGAWYLATGEQLSLSEQQLVDCSWNYDNNGCQGGEMEPAIQYVADHGGIAQEADYQYMGVNAFCGENRTRSSAFFKGFLNVPPTDEKALMEAVHRYGPVAVSIDAALETFKFYSEGVYSDERCHTDPDHMDHAVLLVGYGTTADGVDYWLVKNSWSKFWGEDGYVKMARKGNDCGVTTCPVIAVVADEYVRRSAHKPTLLQQ